MGRSNRWSSISSRVCKQGEKALYLLLGSPDSKAARGEHHHHTRHNAPATSCRVISAISAAISTAIFAALGAIDERKHRPSRLEPAVDALTLAETSKPLRSELLQLQVGDGASLQDLRQVRLLVCDEPAFAQQGAVHNDHWVSLVSTTNFEVRTGAMQEGATLAFVTVGHVAESVDDRSSQRARGACVR